MLMGRAAAPLPDLGASDIEVANELGGRDPIVIEAAPGAVAVDALAAHLSGRGGRPMWARLAPFEIDVSALNTLADAVLCQGGVSKHSSSSAGRVTAVVESPDTLRAHTFLDQVAPALDGAFGPGSTDRVVLHLVADAVERRGGEPVPPRPPPRESGGPLGDRAVGLSGLLAGRPSLLRAVRRAERDIGRSVLADAVHAAGSAEDLTRMISSALLARSHPECRQRLRMAAILGCVHEDFTFFSSALADSRSHPWWVPLEDGWYQVDAAWRTALASLDVGALPVAAVASVVSGLVETGASEEALEFCLDAACPGLASDLLAEITSDLLAAQRSYALRRWLARLPQQEHARHAAVIAQLGPLPRSQPSELGERHAEREGRHRWSSLREKEPRTSDHDEPLGVDARIRHVPAVDAKVWEQRQTPSRLVMSVRLLGAMEVRLDGRPVEQWHGNVGRTALAYVLLQRGRVRPDELAEALWPDVPLTNARNRLHVALHRLRTDLAAIDSRPVLVYKQGYAIDSHLHLDLDIDRFESLAGRGDEALRRADSLGAISAYLAALDCYGGELLAGYRYDEWALLAREHYRVRLLDLLGKAAELAVDLDRLTLALDLGHRLLALDFCREDLHRLLMRVYARLGQPQLALRQYQTCARQLRLEFGLDPAPATVELFNQVRGQMVAGGLPGLDHRT